MSKVTAIVIPHNEIDFNSKLLNGLPLLAHSILQAKNASAINQVVVPTNEYKIAKIAREWGAEVAAGSGVETLEIIREAVKESGIADIIVVMHAASPVRHSFHLDEAIQDFELANGDSLFSSSPVKGAAWEIYNDDITPLRLENETVVENNSFYITTPHLLEKGRILGGKILHYKQDFFCDIKIAKSKDFDLVEGIVQKILQKHLVDIDMKRIKLIVFDFDGVMTDNKVYVSEDGREMVAANRGDGWGIGKLKKLGLDMVIISTEINPVVTARATKLKLQCHQNCPDKLSLIKEVAAEKRLRPDQIAFVGNDENDLPAMQWVGLPIAVGDAEPSVIPHAKIVTRKLGGNGAVREVCEMFYKALTD